LLKIIPLQYASSTEILTQVTPFLTKDRGTATEDKRTSSIVLNDTQAVIAKVSRLIKELDLPPPQVLIEAKIVEATKVFASSIGVRWGASGSTAQISPTGGFQGGPISITPRLNINGTQDAAGLVSSQPLSGSISFGVLDFFGNIDAAIGLSESDDQIRVISSPRVTTLNNVEATITQSSEIIRIQNVVTNGISTTTPIAVPVQLQLKVTPQITSGSSILMQLDVKNEFSGTPVGGQAPKNSRNAIAKVLVENNKTAVIGGIYDKSSVVSDVGVPFLKNIPLIGWLFKTKTTQKRDTEVMMFITPRILDKNYQTTTSANSL
jgi:type IV pilus assembly protein PilQ